MVSPALARISVVASVAPVSLIEHGYVVDIGRAAQVLEGKRFQPIETEGRADLVIGRRQILRLHGKGVLESGEDVDRAAAPLLDCGCDEFPRVLQLPEVVLGVGEDLAARVGKRRRVFIAETVGSHPGLLVCLVVSVPTGSGRVDLRDHYYSITEVSRNPPWW